MQNVSGYGLVVQVTASNTFPTGLSITQFAADTDPLDLATIEVADSEMGLNGDLITWAKAAKKPMVLAVIPGSDDDQNLQILFNANTVGPFNVGARDVIQCTVQYPDGSQEPLYNGIIKAGAAGRSVTGSGKQKTKTYAFDFES